MGNALCRDTSLNLQCSLNFNRRLSQDYGDLAFFRSSVLKFTHRAHRSLRLCKAVDD